MDNEATAQTINKLFDELAAIFPAWKQAFDNIEQVNEAKRQWLKGFQENNISKWEWVEDGLEYARKSESAFLPSVGQFIAWAKPHDPTSYLNQLTEDVRAKVLLDRKQRGMYCGQYEEMSVAQLTQISEGQNSFKGLLLEERN